MAEQVVEVVVRFGDTILDVAHVGPRAAYHIGTAPGVDLAVAGHTCFPLVDGGAFRLPLGAPARTLDGRTVLEIEGVTVELARCEAPVTRIARPRASLRMPAFALGSLVAHLCVWLAAISVEPLERLVESRRPRLRFVHVAHEPEPPLPAAARPTPVQQEPPAPAPAPVLAAAPRKRTADVSAPRSSVDNAARTAAQIASIVDDTRVVERVSALRPEDTYNEDDANAKGFGGSPRFPPGETIKTGEGYELMLYDVKLCPAKSCTLSGPVPESFVRAQLHEHMAAIYDCYVRHASGPGTIVLEFSIGGDGSVRGARGSGLGETGACAARVLPDIYFKAIGDNDVADGQPRVTRVRYPLAFR